MDQGTARVRVGEIEDALTQVAEIKATRVVCDSSGTIAEVHVIALPSKTPKQLARDIESTIMARFGIPIDHRKISIAQLGPDTVITGEKGALSPKMPKPGRPRIVSIHASVSGVHASATVTLEIDGREFVGAAEGAASQTARARFVAAATLDAVGQYVAEGTTFALEDVTVVALGRERVAVACVSLVTPSGEQVYSGSALVRQNEKDSIVRATLDAINRRFGLLTIE